MKKSYKIALILFLPMLVVYGVFFPMYLTVGFGYMVGYLNLVCFHMDVSGATKYAVKVAACNATLFVFKCTSMVGGAVAIADAVNIARTSNSFVLDKEIKSSEEGLQDVINLVKSSFEQCWNSSD